MNTDQKAMQRLFRSVMDADAPATQDGLSIYRFQMRYRRLSIPSQAFLKHLQNIWGSDFVWQLLDDFFDKHPPQSSRWDQVLQALPEFIEAHPDYSRVLALADMVNFSLKVWTCIHSESPSTSHFPADPIDLFLLWNHSESRQEGDPATFWEAVTASGRRGCAFIKISEAESALQPFRLASSSEIL